MLPLRSASLLLLLAGFVPAQGEPALAMLEKRVQLVAERVIPATVSLMMSGTAGSGVIVSEDGYVLTAAHVFSRPDQPVRVLLPEGRIVHGKTLGRMARQDFGLVKITSKGRWPFVPMGSSSALKVGDLCLATGMPGGYGRRRPPPLRLGRILKVKGTYLTTNCTVDSGDSGGPLVDLQGRVIGVHSRIGRFTTENHHVPVDRYRRAWGRLVAGDSWGRPAAHEGAVLGIQGDDGPGGSRVEQIFPGLAADKAKLEIGDVIFRLGDEDVDGMDDLKRLLKKRKPGERVELRIRRGTRTLRKKVSLSPLAEKVAGAKEPGDDASGPAPAPPELPFLRPQKRPKALLKPLARTLRDSVVRIDSGKRRRVLGTLVSDEGLIVTKASDVEDGPVVTLPDGRELPATIVKVFDQDDLVFLRVDAENLVPVGVKKQAPEWRIGKLLLSVMPGRGRLRVGVLGGPPRRITGGRRNAFLGIELETVEGGGARVTRVVPGTAAARADIEKGDVITAFRAKPVKSRQDLVSRIARTRPGTTVKLELMRGELRKEVELELGSRRDIRRSGPKGGPFDPSRFSRRRRGFTRAIQHDTALSPHECGSPVFDREGRFLGVNIARASRHASFLLPADLVKKRMDALPRSKR